MADLNRRLIGIVGLGWLAFAVAGVGLRQVLSGPKITVVIDRSYCNPGTWQQQVVVPYRRLYEQSEQHRLTIDQVIYLSDLGMETANPLPAPDDVSALSTYGRFNPEQLQRAKLAHPQATVLSCGSSSP